MMLNSGVNPFAMQPAFTSPTPFPYQAPPSLMDGSGAGVGFAPQPQPTFIGNPNPQASRPQLNTASAEAEAQAAANQPSTGEIIANSAADYMIATGNPWVAGAGILLKGIVGGK